MIDRLSLSVENGERVVVFGPSGCGKSTLLHLVAGLIVPDAGEILLDNELVARAHKNLREPEQRGAAMVFQDLALWPHMTLAENIEFGLKAKRVSLEWRKQRVREMVTLVKLSNLCPTSGYREVSNQRVALASSRIGASHLAYGRAAFDT